MWNPGCGCCGCCGWRSPLPGREPLSHALLLGVWGEGAGGPQGWVALCRSPWAGPGRTLCVSCVLSAPGCPRQRGLWAAGRCPGVRLRPRERASWQVTRVWLLEEASMSQLHMEEGQRRAETESKKAPPSPTAGDIADTEASHPFGLLCQLTGLTGRAGASAARGHLRVCSSSSFTQHIVTELDLLCARHFFSPGDWTAILPLGGPCSRRESCDVEETPPSVSPSLKWEWLIPFCLQVLGCLRGSGETVDKGATWGL